MSTVGDTLTKRMQRLSHAVHLSVYSRTSRTVRAVCTKCGAVGEILHVNGDQMSGSVMRGPATTQVCAVTRSTAAAVPKVLQTSGSEPTLLVKEGAEVNSLP